MHQKKIVFYREKKNVNKIKKRLSPWIKKKKSKKNFRELLIQFNEVTEIELALTSSPFGSLHIYLCGFLFEMFKQKIKQKRKCTRL